MSTEIEERDSYVSNILEWVNKINNENLSKKEKEEFLSEIEKYQQKVKYKELVIENLKIKIDKEVKEFNIKVEKSETIVEDEVSIDNNGNTTIRSPLEDKNLMDFLREIRNNWYNNLNSLQQICFSLLILNSVIFVCIINICFSLFGEYLYLIKRFLLESRYPKLSKLLLLRKTFQNYYLKINLLLIILIIIGEMLFSIAVITL